MNLRQLHWPLIVGLGALALIRPVLSITGLMEILGRPFGPILITILISLAWLAIVVLVRARQPLLTLVFAGISYGVFAIVISAVLSPLLTGQLSGPITNPIAVVAVLITNAIWGAAVGACALAVQALTTRVSQ
ncbi:MAG TPA: hypothetical protein VGD69_09810 [Herpetosiphonaceae bacterium]